MDTVERLKLKNRKSRKFWTTEGREVTGYECPGTEGAWWVPEEGTTQWEGKHLFGGKVEGVEKGLDRLRERKRDLELEIRRLERILAWEK